MKNIWKKLVLFASLLCLLITSTMTYGSSQSVKAKTSGVEGSDAFFARDNYRKDYDRKKHRTDDREENRNDDTGSAAGDR